MKFMRFRARWLPVLLLLLLQIGLHAQTQIVQAEYFIDSDPGAGQATSIPVTPGDTIDAPFTAPLTGIPEGFHLFCARVKTSDNIWMVSYSKVIYINPYAWPIPPPTGYSNPMVEAEYFIDTDPGEGKGIPIMVPIGNSFDIHRTLQTDTFSAGSYIAGIRVRQLDKTWSCTFGVSFEVYENPPCAVPIPGFSHDTALYAGAPVTFFNQSNNTLPGATFEWDILANDTVDYTTFNASHTFSSPGIYDVKLTVSNGNDSCTVSIIKQIEIGPVYSNQIIVNGFTTICSGDSVMLSAPNGSGWLWSDGRETQTIAAKINGSYQAYYTDPNGNPQVSDIVNIHVDPAIQIDLLVNQATDGAANGSAGVEVSGGSAWIYGYNWSNGDTLETAANLSAGVYSVTVDDQVCPQTLSVVIPNLTTTGQGILAAEYFIDTDPGVGNGTSLSLNWGNNISSFVHIPITSIALGWHTLVVRVKSANGLWCVGTPYKYFIQPLVYPEVPDPSPLVNWEIYMDEDNGVATGDVFPLIPTALEAQDLLTTSIAGLSIGYHRVFVRAQNDEGLWGIEGFKDFLVDVILPEVDTTHYPLVEAEYFFNSDPGEGNGTQVFIPVGDTLDMTRTVDYSVLAEGDHKFGFRVRDLKGEWGMPRFAEFSIYTPSCITPQVSYVQSAANAGQAVVLTNTSMDVAPAATYQWDVFADGTTDYTTVNISHTFSLPGNYDVLLKVMNSDSCFSSYLGQVEIGPFYPLDITASGPTEFCEGNNLTLTSPTGNNYLWNTGETTSSIQVVESGEFKVAYTDLYGNHQISNPVATMVHPSLEIIPSISPANVGTANGSVNISLTGGTGFQHDYFWSTGSSFQSLTNLMAGTYTVSVTDPYCPASLAVEIPTLGSIQGLVAAEYFLEVDPGPGNGIPLMISHQEAINSFFQIDMNNILAGYHQIYFRVKNSSGLWGIVRRLQVHISEENPIAQDPTYIVAGEYFFDSDPGIPQAIEIPNLSQGLLIDQNIDVDVSGLDNGIHRLLLRVKNNEDNWSTVGFMNFYLEPEMEAPDTTSYPLVAGELFFGDDPGEGNGLPFSLPGNETVDVSRSFQGLTQTNGNYEGYIRVKQMDGHWSLPEPFGFTVYDTSGCSAPLVDFINYPAIAGNAMLFDDQSANAEPGAIYEWTVFDTNNTSTYSGSQALHIFSTPGFYDVELKVSNSFVCFSSIIKTVEVGPYYDNTISENGPTNFCGGDSVILTAPSGTDYLWSTGETTASITALSGGNYQVSYQNQNAIQTLSNSVEVSVLPKIDLVMSASPANTGMSNGSANVIAQGGSQFFYNYNWSNGGTSPMIVGQPAGQFSVSVSDTYCTDSADVIIASINIPIDGIVAAEFFIDTDPGPGNATPVQIPLADEIDSYFEFPMNGFAPGYYVLNFRVQRASGLWSHVHPLFMTISDWDIEPPYPLPDVVDVEYFFDTTDPGEDSAIHFSNFTPAQTFNEDITVSTTGIGYGEHEISFRVKDDAGHWSIVGTKVIQICDPPLMPTAGADIAICEGDTLNLTAGSIQTGITYFWEGPDGFTSTNQNPSILNVLPSMEGEYKAYAVEGGDCFSEPDLVNVSVNPLPLDAGNIIASGASCQDTSTIVYFVPPIPNAIQYEWTFPDSAVVLAGNNTNNIAVNFINYQGSFDLQVRGTNVCGIGNWSPVLQVNVEEPVTPVCPNDTILNSFNTPFPLTGANPLSGIYLGDGVQNGIFYPALAGPGIHTIEYFYYTMGGCAGLCQFTVTVLSSCAAPTNLLSGPVTSNSVELGWTAGASENEWEIRYGLPGFSPLNGGSLIQQINGNQYILTGLNPSTSYDIYVRSVCSGNEVSTWTGPVNVTLLSGLSFSAVVTDATCNNGSIVLQNIQGTPPFTFLWSNGAVVQNPSALSPGSYMVTVTDNVGFTGVDTFTVNSNPLLVEAIVSDDTGLSDGSIDVSILGGSTPYSFLWGNGSTNEDLINLAAGSYGLTITDAYGCQVDSGFTIIQTLSTVTQVIPVDTSWSLISFYIEPTNNALPSVFDDIMPYLQAVKKPGANWLATNPPILNDLNHILNGEAYWIKTNDFCTIQTEGTVIDPGTFLVELDSGWNPVAYIGQQQQLLTTALAGIQPVLMEVKARSSSWNITNPPLLNTLTTLKPGFGYFINVSSDTSFYFPQGTKGVVFAEEEELPYKPVIYTNSTTMVGEIILGNTIAFDEGSILLAKVDGEIRAVSRVIEIDGRHYASLVICGLEQEIVGFELICPKGMYTSETRVLSKPGSNIGLFDEPKPILFKTSSEIEEAPLVSTFNVYPNPFKDNLTIRLDLLHETELQIDVYNSMGQKVRTVFNGNMDKGEHTFTWDGLGFPNQKCAAGLYQVHIKGEGFYQTKSVILLSTQSNRY